MTKWKWFGKQIVSGKIILTGQREKKIKLVDAENEGNVYPPLKKGDKVKVKFGSRWYNAEVLKSRDPKAKKGKCYIFVVGDRLRAVSIHGTDDQLAKPQDASAPVLLASRKWETARSLKVDKRF